MDLSNETVIHVKTEKQDFLQFRRLLQYSDIISHCYSLGLDKNYRTFKADGTELPAEDFEKNMNNYKTICEANEMNYKNIVKAKQAHTDNVVNIEILNKNNKIDTIEPSDGLITNKNNIILATTNADCILLLFFDPVKKVIANTHSGWKGTLQEISVKTVNKMVSDYGCATQDIIVCMLPSIRKCHFEVDKEVYQMFYNQFEKLGNIDEFITKNGDKWNIDTVYINKKILEQAGILPQNIEDSKICSVCNKNIVHSFRAEGKSYGLATAMIELKK